MCCMQERKHLVLMQMHIHSLKGYTQNATNAGRSAASSPTILNFTLNVQHLLLTYSNMVKGNNRNDPTSLSSSSLEPFRPIFSKKQRKHSWASSNITSNSHQNKTYSTNTANKTNKIQTGWTETQTASLKPWQAGHTKAALFFLVH